MPPNHMTTRTPDPLVGGPYDPVTAIPERVETCEAGR